MLVANQTASASGASGCDYDKPVAKEPCSNHKEKEAMDVRSESMKWQLDLN